MLSAFWIFCLASGLIAILIPFLIMIGVAGRFDLHHPVYYVSASLITGFINAPVFLVVSPPMDWVFHDGMSFLQKWGIILPYMLISGLGGGLAYWWTTGRHMRPSQDARSLIMVKPMARHRSRLF